MEESATSTKIRGRVIWNVQGVDEFASGQPDNDGTLLNKRCISLKDREKWGKVRLKERDAVFETKRTLFYNVQSV